MKAVDNIRFLEVNRQSNLRFEDLDISIFEDPAGTFSADTALVESIIAEITAFTAKSFGGELDEDSNDGTYRHVVNNSRLVVIHSDSEILGFAGEKTLAVEEVMYLHGVAVSNRAKSRGVGRKLVETLLVCSEKPLIGFTTQSPIMFCVARDLLNRSINPRPGRELVSPELAHIGLRLMEGRSGVFDPDRFVAQDLYGECLYPQIPRSNDPLVNTWFDDSLRVVDGVTRDGFLFIGEV